MAPGGDTEQRLRAAQECLEMLSRAMEDMDKNVLEEAASPETPGLMSVDASLHVTIAATLHLWSSASWRW